MSLAQVAYTQARISARLDTTRIYIGNAVRLHVTLQTPDGAGVTAPSTIIDSTISVLDTVVNRTTLRGNDRIFMQTWTLTAFDSGHFVVPLLPYTCTVNGKTDTLYTPVLAFDAIPMPTDTTKIKLIAPIMDEAFWWSDAKLAILLLLLSAIGFLLYLYLRYKQIRRIFQTTNTVPPEPEIPAHEWAYAALQNLEKAAFLQKNEQKKHYIELSNIFRIYIEKRYQISVLEKTSDEMLPILQKKIENWAFFEYDTRTFLQTTDLIKFAKAQISPKQDAELWVFVEDFIQKTKNEQTQNL